MLAPTPKTTSTARTAARALVARPLLRSTWVSGSRWRRRSARWVGQWGDFGDAAAARAPPLLNTHSTTQQNTKKKSLRGPGAVLGVQAVVSMDLVRALRHCFWKLAVGQVRSLFCVVLLCFVVVCEAR